MKEKCKTIDQLDVICEKLKGIADTLSMISERNESVILTPEQMTLFELNIREIEDQLTAVRDGMNEEEQERLQ